MGNLLKLSYWFNPLPGPFLVEYLKIVYAFFGFLVICGLVAWYFRGKKKKDKIYWKFWQKVQHACLVLGIIGLALIFFRQQSIYYLSMPFLFIILMGGIIIWAYLIFKYIIKIMPQRKKEQQEAEAKKRYLP